MAILISFYTVNRNGRNGHLRDELYATLDKVHLERLTHASTLLEGLQVVEEPIFLSLSFSVSSNKEGKDDNKVFPSYFSLAIHWPISLCNAEQLCSKKFNHDLQSSFTIQGLWPFNATGQMLKYCHTTKVLTNSKVYLQLLSTLIN